MMMTLEVLAPVKINLFLHITGRRDDNYHNLQTLFQLVDFHDELTFSLRDDDAIHLGCSDPSLSTKDNLVLNAAYLLRQAANANNLGVDIYLEKNIPTGAGLGGGSSDAASTLLALNTLWQLNFPLERLMELGRQLGADVPVFIAGQTAWADGIGDQLTPAKSEEQWFVVLTPDCHIDTSVIYNHESLERDVPVVDLATFDWRDGHNSCQALVYKLYPEVKEILDWLTQQGLARLTGTGASVFAVFDSKQEAMAVFEQKPASCRGFIAKGLQNSPTQLAIQRI